MWGDLANRLGAKDLNSTLQKIGNAVAPPPDEYEDDGEYDDEYEGEDYDDDEEYEDDEQDGGGFGFVGLLARALDDRNDDTSDESEENEPALNASASAPRVFNDRSLVSEPEITTSKNTQASTPFDVVAASRPKSVPLTAPKEETPKINNRAPQQQQQASRPQLRVPDPRNQLRDKVALSSQMTRNSRQSTEPKEGIKPKVEIKAERIEQKKPVHVKTQSKPTAAATAEKPMASKKTEATTARRIQQSTNKVTQVKETPRLTLPQKQQANRVAEVTKPKEALRLADLQKPQQQVKEVPTLPVPTKPAVTQAKTTKPAREAIDDPRNVLQETGKPKTEQKRTSNASTQRKRQSVSSPNEQVASGASGTKPKGVPQKTVKPTTEPNVQEKQTRAPLEQKQAPVPTSETKVQQPKKSEKRPSDASNQRRRQPASAPNEQVTTGTRGTNEYDAMIRKLQNGNKLLQEELAMAKQQIIEWQQKALAHEQTSDSTREQLLIDFQEKEARLLQVTTEEHQQELLRMEQKMESEMHALTEEMAKQRSQFVTQHDQYRAVIEQSESRAEKAEADLKKLRKKQDNQLSQVQQREERIAEMAEDKVAQTMAVLDERDEQILNLKNLIRDLESKMDEHEEGAEEAEEDIEELQTENESLQGHIHSLQNECSQLKTQIADLEIKAEHYSGMQMELTMLREERDRERAKNEGFVESAMSTNTKIESERNEALSEVRDVKHQLTAALADLEIAKADISRITTANNNLQSALEAFQDERRAEMDLLDEQQKGAEDAITAAHKAATEALRQAHSAEIKQVQNAADMAVKHTMDEVSALNARIEKLKSENFQMRRSLDEAIHRLQTSQEDVIDRTLMKNILLDWCTMKDKPKRQQVLELMASVLHFNEEERDKVHLTHMDIESVRSRVVGALAAPLPPSKADVDHLEGENVSEKFLNFLMAETDDGF